MLKKTLSTMLVIAVAMTSAFAQKKGKKEAEKPAGYQFTVVKENPITPIKNQASSGTCWSYSTISFLESEAIKAGAPANIDLAGAEIELVSQIAREYFLKRALAEAAEEFDDVFIDCPPALGLLTLNALAAADKLLVPIQCEFFALEGLADLMSTVSLVRKNLNPNLQVEGVVMTMFDKQTNLSRQVVQEVQRFFPNKVYQSFIPRNVRLAEAPSFGLPVILYDKNCAGSQAYMSLAREYVSGVKEQ